MKKFHFSTVRMEILTKLIQLKRSSNGNGTTDSVAEVATLGAKLKDCEEEKRRISEQVKRLHADWERCVIEMKKCVTDLEVLARIKRYGEELD